MADGDFGGTEGGGFSFGDAPSFGDFGTSSFGSGVSDAAGPGISFGDASSGFGTSGFGTGGLSEGISFDPGLFASNLGTSLVGEFGAPASYGLTSLSPSYSEQGPGFSFAGAPSSGAFGTSAFGGQQGGFANAMKSLMMNLMKGKAMGALGAKTGIPGFALNIMAALAQGKSPAGGMMSALMGPFSMVDSLISQLTGQPSLAQAVGSHPGSPGGFGAAMAATPGAGATPGGWLPALFNLGTGLYGMSQARSLGRSGRPTAGQQGADARLAALMGGGGDYTTSPAYRQGEQAILRQMAAQGYLGSGNLGTALSDYNRAFVGDEMRLMNQLAQPRAGQLERELGGIQLRGQGLQSLGYGMSQLLPLLRGMGGGEATSGPGVDFSGIDLTPPAPGTWGG